MLNVVGKIYVGILMDRMNEGAQQILTLKQLGEKAREKKQRVFVDFMDLD